MLTLQKYRFNFKALNDFKEVRNWGSAIRGAFGYALKEQNESVFQLMYQPSIEVNHRAYEWVKTDVPSPFIICPEHYIQDITKNEIFSFEIVLIGTIRYQFEIIKKALIQSMEKGLEQGMIKFQFLNCEIVPCSIFNTPIIDFENYKNLQITSSHVQFTFLQPVNIIHQKKLATDFAFENIYKAIHRRFLILSSIYGIDTQESYAIKNIPNIDLVSSKLFNRFVYRKSNNKTAYPMHGWMGKLIYKDTQQQLHEILDKIVFCEHLHIGRNTVFGMGKYYFEELNQ